MGNAHTHDRRKSGAPETGLTIEGIREKPLPQHERKQGRVEKKVCTGVYVSISSKIIASCEDLSICLEKSIKGFYCDLF